MKVAGSGYFTELPVMIQKRLMHDIYATARFQFPSQLQTSKTKQPITGIGRNRNTNTQHTTHNTHARALPTPPPPPLPLRYHHQNTKTQLHMRANLFVKITLLLCCCRIHSPLFLYIMYGLVCPHITKKRTAPAQ